LIVIIIMGSRMFLSLFFFVLTLGCTQAEYLRQGPAAPASVEEPNRHRSLIVTSVPFKMEIDLRTATNRQPDDADYAGAVQAVASWFGLQSFFFYDNRTPGVTYVDTTCQLKSSSSGGSTIYDASAEYQHTISMDCATTFESSEAGLMVPTSSGLVLQASENYEFRDFFNHMLEYAPAGSVFRGITGATYRMSDVLPNFIPSLSTTTTPESTPTMGPTTSQPTPSPTTRPPTMPTTTSSPTRSPTTPSPTLPPTMPINGTFTSNHTAASSSNSSTPSAINGTLVTLEAVLEWKLGLSPEGQPSESDYDTFLTLMEDWQTKVFDEIYNSDPNLPTFVSMDPVFVSKDYTPKPQDPSHTLVTQSNLQFALAPGQSAPQMWHWVQPLRSAGLTEYRTQYLWSERGGIWKGTNWISWRAP
jgi:hypothetical protein